MKNVYDAIIEKELENRIIYPKTVRAICKNPIPRDIKNYSTVLGVAYEFFVKADLLRLSELNYNEKLQALMTMDVVHYFNKNYNEDNSEDSDIVRIFKTALKYIINYISKGEWVETHLPNSFFILARMARESKANQIIEMHQEIVVADSSVFDDFTKLCKTKTHLHIPLITNDYCIDKKCKSLSGYTYISKVRSQKTLIEISTASTLNFKQMIRKVIYGANACGNIDYIMFINPRFDFYYKTSFHSVFLSKEIVAEKKHQKTGVSHSISENKIDLDNPIIPSIEEYAIQEKKEEEKKELDLSDIFIKI